MKLETKYEEELETLVEGCSSILDVGCGSDSPIKGFSKRLEAVGVDSFEASLKKSAERGIHQRYVQTDIRSLDEHFAPRSFDCVLASDVIEHLTKDDGWKLLESMERIARKRVIVFTPNGFLPQGEWESNPWQVHQSGWTTEELRDRGYHVIGLRGWKPLRGEYATIRFPPKFLWLFISSLSQRWVRNRPQNAFQILCWKDIPSSR